jgi:hypothetical protein
MGVIKNPCIGPKNYRKGFSGQADGRERMPVVERRDIVHAMSACGVSEPHGGLAACFNCFVSV